MRRLISVSLAVALLLAAVPVALGLLQGLSRSHGAAASASLTCSVRASCDVGEVAVFRMSGLANAHAQTADTHPLTYDYSNADLKVAHCSNRFCVPYHRPR